MTSNAMDKVREAYGILILWEVDAVTCVYKPEARSARDVIFDVRMLLQEALRMPPRNCDRFATVKDAAIAFARERQDAPHPCPDFTFSAWLLAPAKKKEGGAS